MGFCSCCKRGWYLVEPPLETAATAIASTADSSESRIGQIDTVASATHTLVADCSLYSGTGVWVLDGEGFAAVWVTV